MDNYTGRLLDERYEILERIGTGGMAVVYKARCNRLNRLVAIKILKSELSKDDEFRRRFHAESQAVAQLSHPNIVAVYDVSHSQSADYIVMELIEGITLKQYMEQKGTLNWREALHFATQIAKALDHAHSRGIIHRDIKPHNIMVLKDGSVKVADFGIAQMATVQNTLTREALGSVHYISPEQAKGAHVDARTDLYSLGVVLYEMLTGRPPFDGDTPVSVAIQHINAKAPAPRTLNPLIPAGLEQITMHAMTANRDERYLSAAEMLEDLETFRRNPNCTFDFTLPRGNFSSAEPASAPEAGLQSERMARPAPAVSHRPVRATAQRRQTEEKGARVAVLAGIVCIVIAIFGICYFLYSYFFSDLFSKTAEDTVPNLLGQNFETLDRSLYPNFQIEVKQWRASEEAVGVILDQSPVPDRTAKVGTTIELTVSSGTQGSAMPELAGMTLPDALTCLKTMSIAVTVNPLYETNDATPEGRVIRTVPEAGTELNDGQTVNVYVSQGSAAETVPVPTLVGLPVEQAQTLIVDSGLSVGSANAVESDLPEGTVTFQSVEPGTEARKGTVINLQVSRGPETADTPIILSQSWDTTVDCREELTLEISASASDKGVLSYAWYQTPSGSTDDGVLVSSGESCEVDTTTPGSYYYFCKVVNTLGDTNAFVYSATICVTVVDTDKEVILHVRMPSSDGTYSVSVMVGDDWKIEPFLVDMSEHASRDLELPVRGSGLCLVSIFLDGEEYDTQLVDFDVEGY